MDRRRVNVNTTTSFYVRAAGTGGQYLTERVRRAQGQGKYCWRKTSKNDATLMSYDAAQKAAQRYGGEVIRREVVVLDQPVGI